MWIRDRGNPVLKFNKYGLRQLPAEGQARLPDRDLDRPIEGCGVLDPEAGTRAQPHIHDPSTSCSISPHEGDSTPLPGPKVTELGQELEPATLHLTSRLALNAIFCFEGASGDGFAIVGASFRTF